jgi:glutamate synthase (NADPH/NADH) large chain
MSLATQIGREGNVFELTPDNARQVMLNSPVLSQRKLRQLLSLPDFADAHERIDLYLRAGESLPQALQRLCAEAEAAVRRGRVLLLLSDRFPARRTCRSIPCSPPARSTTTSCAPACAATAT